MKGSDKENNRPEAYPKPTESDTQMKNQNEFTERESAHRSEDMPVHSGQEQNEESQRSREQRRDLL